MKWLQVAHIVNVFTIRTLEDEVSV